MDPLNPREPFIPEELECAMEVIRAKVPLPYLETMQDYVNHIRADDKARITELEAALASVVQFAEQADDPKHHTLGLIKHIAAAALNSLPNQAN